MPTHRHRHFVALPLATGALLLVFGTHAFLGDSFAVGADTVTLVTQNDERTVDITPLLSAHLAANTFARADRTGLGISVERGEVTVRSSGYVKVDLGNGNSAHVLGGVASFLRGTSTTVVALSVPVMIETAQGRALLAMGQQLVISSSGVARSAIPAEWSSARLASLPSEARTTNSTEEPNMQIAALLDEDSIATSEDIAHLLGALTDVAGQSDLSSLAALSLLTSGRSIDKQAAQELGKALLASADIRSHVPLALVQIARVYGRPLPEPLVALWSDELVRTASTDIALALDALSSGADAAVRLRALGYPISADEWQNAVQQTSSVLRSIAKSEAEKQRIASAERHIHSAKLSPLLANLEPPKTEEVNVTKIPTLSPDAMLALSSSMLFNRGALLTGDTTLTIDPTNPARVLIRGFFHEEQGQLISYDASHDPVADMLWLTRAGERLSNPVSSPQFFQ